MSIQKHARTHSVRLLAHAALPLALAFALTSRSPDLQAAEAWRTTKTQAAIFKVATPPPTPLPTSAPPAPSNTRAGNNSSPAPSSHWALNIGDQPQVQDDLVVTPLPLGKEMHIVLTLAMRNRDGFYDALHDIYDPASASYRKYMTPETFKAGYGPTDEDAQKVVAYLQQKGFTEISVSPTNQLVSAKGDSSKVDEAFNLSMKQFTLDGQQFYGNDSAPQVPQSLANIVTAVLGLQNVNVKHTYNHVFPMANGDGVHVGHSPIALQKIYHVGGSPSAYATSVAVIGWNDPGNTQNDLDLFTAANSLDPVKLEVVKVPAYADFPAGDDLEWAMDTQTIVGVSGGVKRLLFYAAPNPTDGDIVAVETRAVDDNIAKLINCSFGVSEIDPALDNALPYETDLFARAEAQGQIFSISSGDTGAFTWAAGRKLLDALKSEGNHYSVSWPAASSHVVAVGGTNLFTTTSDSTVWAGEDAWNVGIAGDGTFWAGGGGISRYIDVPDWQKHTIGVGVEHRVLPDLAFSASQSVVIYNGKPTLIGGTSLSSPIFVGAFARIETAANNSIGLPNRDIYRDFSNGGHAEILHDVTSGNNGIAGGPDVAGFSAGRGFDLVTGWGSFDIDRLRELAVVHWGDGSAPPPAPIKPAAVTTMLQNNATGQASGKPDVGSQFAIYVPAGTRKLNVRSFGGSGDVILYVKFNAVASASSHDFVSDHRGTNNESITIDTKRVGIYYVTVVSPVTYANVNVSARYIEP